MDNFLRLHLDIIMQIGCAFLIFVTGFRIGYEVRDAMIRSVRRR
jgi:hypothetical protein